MVLKLSHTNIGKSDCHIYESRFSYTYIWAISKKMKSKRDIRSQKLFLTDACILYLFDKWNHSSS